MWDSISAKVVADTPGTAAIATASHAIAASWGYPDGEKIPVDTMIGAVGRIVEATTLPVTADLEAGYGDPAGTIRKAIGVGVVGANVEDQMRPLDEAVRNVAAIMDAAISEGVPDFVLNARTDAFVLGRDRDPADVLADAVERGKAYLDAGAPTVFVPGLLNEEQISTLVEAFGPQKLTVIGFPGSLAAGPARRARRRTDLLRPAAPAGGAHGAAEAGGDHPSWWRHRPEHEATPDLTMRLLGLLLLASVVAACGDDFATLEPENPTRAADGLVFTRADGSSYEMTDAVATCLPSEQKPGVDIVRLTAPASVEAPAAPDMRSVATRG